MFPCIQTISYSIKWDFMNCKPAEKIYHPNAASVSEALFLCKIPLSLVLHFLSSFPLTAKRTTYFTVSELCFWRQITSVNAMSLRMLLLAPISPTAATTEPGNKTFRKHHHTKHLAVRLSPLLETTQPNANMSCSLLLPGGCQMLS